MMEDVISLVKFLKDNEEVFSKEIVSNKDSLLVPIGLDIDTETAVSIKLNKDNNSLLCCGQTGSGKTSLVNDIIISTNYLYSKDIVRINYYDCKGVEARRVSKYNIPIMRDCVAVDSVNSRRVIEDIRDEIDNRVSKLRGLKVSNIEEYNNLRSVNKEDKLPYLIIIIDEYVELLNTSDESLYEDVKNLYEILVRLGLDIGVYSMFFSQSTGTLPDSIKELINNRICLSICKEQSISVLGDESAVNLPRCKGYCIIKNINTMSSNTVKIPFISDNELEEFLKNE